MNRMLGIIGIAAAVMAALGAVGSLSWAQIPPYGAWSLALDPQGQPRISYVLGQLWLASRDGNGTWSQEAVVGTGGPVYADAWVGTSLAIDATGVPLIAYFVGAGDYRPLELAHGAGGAWSVETVDPGGRGAFPSLALDGMGRPRVAYVDEMSGTLKYCAWDGSSWTFETVAAVSTPNASVPFGCSLALEADDDPCISFFDFLDSHVKVASRHSGIWSIEVVQGPLGATWSSLALEADDDPCIGFCDPAGNLKLATRNGGSWDVETVDQVGDTGGGGWIALDSAGDPCVAYGDATDWQLRFAEKQGGSWSSVTVDAGSWSTGIGAVLELDAQDRPHVAYNVSRDVRGLEHATRSGTVWQSELVVPWPAGVGGQPSRPLSLAAWPNPVGGGELRVAFSAPGVTHATAELTLYDVTGRRVVTLYRGPVSADPRQVSWDGRDQRGRPTRAGVYLLTAYSSGGKESRLRVVVLR